MEQAFSYLTVLFLYSASYIKDCLMKFELIGIDYLSNIFTLERTWPLTNRPLALGPICLWLYHFVGVILTSLSFGTIIPRDSARQEEGRKRVTLAKSLLFGS